MGAKVSSEMWSPCPFKTYTPKELRAEIETIQSQSASLMSGENIRIVICAIGKDGKSSTINNIATALEDKHSITASIGGRGSHSHVTQKYIEYRMLVGNIGAAKDTCYVLCDTPGLREDGSDVEAEAIKAVIEGKFQSGDTLDYEKLTLEGLGKMQARQSMAACVIFVVAATKVHFTSSDIRNAPMVMPQGLNNLKSILTFARYNDITTACMMTKCDEMDTNVKKDMRNIYYSTSIERARHVLKETFDGFPENRIFPIVNYSKSLNSNPNMMVQTLFALKHILNDIHSSLRKTVRSDGTC